MLVTVFDLQHCKYFEPVRGVTDIQSPQRLVLQRRALCIDTVVHGSRSTGAPRRRWY